MYSGSGLSISPIEDMANCDIDIDNSGGKRGSCGMPMRYTTKVEALQRSPTAIQPIGLIQMDLKIRFVKVVIKAGIMADFSFFNIINTLTIMP